MEQENKPTDKEAILYKHWKKWADETFKDVDTTPESFNDNFHHSFVLAAMDEYAVNQVESKSIFIAKLKDDIHELYEEQHKLQSSNEAKEKECEYWKQRCEAAESVITSYNSDDSVYKYDELFREWQQVKATII